MAGAALFGLLVAMTLAVFKPKGMTPYGQRKLQERRGALGETASLQISAEAGDTAVVIRRGSGLRIFFVIGAILLAFVVLHLIGGHGGHIH